MQNHWPPDRYGYAENDKSTPTNLALYATDKMEHKGITFVQILLILLITRSTKVNFNAVLLK